MNPTKTGPLGGLPSAPTQARALDSIISIEQLSLADGAGTSSWRDPVRRRPREPNAAPRTSLPPDDALVAAATMAALHLIEARADKADPWELRRALSDLRAVQPALRGDDEREYARGLSLKLQALLEAQWVRDVAAGGSGLPGDLH